MSSDHFESVLNSLNSQNVRDKEILKILVSIRKEVEWPEKRDNIKKLREKGCLKHIIICLQQQKQHVNIINMALSILGNCCMDRVCARDAVKQYTLLPHLNNILKCNKRDSIRGRIFRIIGNMCQHWDRLANTILEKEPQLQLVTKIVDFLKGVARCDGGETSKSNKETKEEKPSQATIIMAIRALRVLANVNTIILLIRDCGVMKAAGMILIKYVPEWETTKEHEEILTAILKLLCLYSRCRNYNSIPELHNTETGNAMTYLSKLIHLSPYVVVKIIMNFMTMSTLRSDLPVIDVSQNLIEKLKSGDNFVGGREDLLHREYIKCLCFLLQHPANKSEMRDAGLIPLLLTVITDSKEPTEIAMKNCMLIISTLRLCLYDETSLISMIKLEIINALIEKLEWVVGSDVIIDTSHEYRVKKQNQRESRKRRRFITDHYFMHRMRSEGFGIPCCNLDSDYYRYRDRGVNPFTDIPITSGPTFSPPASPTINDDYANCVTSDSDDYSPVCSDAEGDHPMNENQVMVNDFENVHSPFYIDNNDKEDEQEALSDSSSLSGVLLFKKDLANEIVKLIKLFVQVRPVPVELSSSNLLVKLLMFMLPKNRPTCPPDTLSVVLLIVETPEFLLGLLQTDFIIYAYKLTVLQHGIGCMCCTNMYSMGRNIMVKFTMVVEFGRGKGDIGNELVRASLPVKRKLVTTIPFLIENKYTLNELMATRGGLDILMNLFQECAEERQRSISSLGMLAKNLRVKNPNCYSDETMDKVIHLPINIDSYEVSTNCTNIVRFVLDDGSILQADRDFLSSKIDYFNCLLSGEFKESSEQEIRLYNVTNSSLRLLFMLLQLGINNTNIYNIETNMDALLDAIIVSDRYLMEEISAVLNIAVQYFKFLPQSIPSIYQWSLESGTNLLRIESIAYILVGEMSDLERYNIFQDMSQLGYLETLVDDIYQLLNRCLIIGKND